MRAQGIKGVARSALTEPEILELMRKHGLRFYDPVSKKRAAEFLPAKLLWLPNVAEGQCNWALGELPGPPKPAALYLQEEARKLQAVYNLKPSQSPHDAIQNMPA